MSLRNLTFAILFAVLSVFAVSCGQSNEKKQTEGKAKHAESTQASSSDQEHPVNISLLEFQQLTKGDKLVLVDFYTTWCGPCKVMAPLIEKVRQEHADQMKVVKIDCEQNVDLANYFRIQGYPTVKLFKGGLEVEHHLGGLTESQIVELITPHLN